ncbi:MAG TPA: phosphoesterase, partial [Candidatus Limnocylindria bacterium]|nr:phosphoesterase [Candidatus Limnocylindria bacterium]
FAEYTSGHSTYSGAASEVFMRFAGTATFQTALTVTMPAGSSTIGPGLVPRDDTWFRFTSFTAAADHAGKSRRYGAIHLRTATCKAAASAKVGGTAWAKALTYFNGTAG